MNQATITSEEDMVNDFHEQKKALKLNGLPKLDKEEVEKIKANKIKAVKEGEIIKK